MKRADTRKVSGIKGDTLIVANDASHLYQVIPRICLDAQFQLYEFMASRPKTAYSIERVVPKRNRLIGIC